MEADLEIGHDLELEVAEAVAPVESHRAELEQLLDDGPADGWNAEDTARHHREWCARVEAFTALVNTEPPPVEVRAVDSDHATWRVWGAPGWNAGIVDDPAPPAPQCFHSWQYGRLRPDGTIVQKCGGCGMERLVT